MPQYDAIIIGSGPNGLSAAIELQKNGLSTLVVEAKDEIGGGTRTKELTLPGFKHDICSAIHPLGVGSPFLRKLPLEKHGLQWIYPPVEMAHPFPDGTAVALYRSISDTGAQFKDDELNYQQLLKPLVDAWKDIEDAVLGPLRMPGHPVDLIKFGLKAIQPANSFADRHFNNPRTKSYFAGLAAHAMVPLDYIATSAIGLVLTILGHLYGWPFPKGGAVNITRAMESYYKKLGGEIKTGWKVNNIDELPSHTHLLFNLSPRELLRIAGDQLPRLYKKQLEQYRYGMGVFKIDYALSAEVPFRSEVCRRAGTIHLGRSFKDINISEKSAWEGDIHDNPFILLAQQSLFDESRAPQGKYTLWAYCHVPLHSDRNITDIIEQQIEIVAPGFKDVILDKHIMTARDFEAYNPNYTGGDINGGAQYWRQLFTRPAIRINPYKIPVKGMYICSSSTPPGGGVHGMAGYHTARMIIRKYE